MIDTIVILAYLGTLMKTKLIIILICGITLFCSFLGADEVRYCLKKLFHYVKFKKKMVFKEIKAMTLRVSIFDVVTSAVNFFSTFY